MHDEVGNVTRPPKEKGAINFPNNLRLVKEDGSIRNEESPEKDRQVIFRVDTFNKLLSRMYDFVSSDYQFAFDELMHNCGRQSGVEFAQSMVGKWKGGEELSLTDLMNKWFLFDSTSGFGVFSIHRDNGFDNIHDSIYKENTEISIGIIKISNCFQLVTDISERDKKKDSKNKYFCFFVRGYCEGVLNVLEKDNLNAEKAKCTLKVECLQNDKNGCYRKIGGQKKDCYLDVKLKPK